MALNLLKRFRSLLSNVLVPGGSYKLAAFLVLQVYGFASILSVVFTVAIVPIGLAGVMRGSWQCGVKAFSNVQGENRIQNVGTMPNQKEKNAKGGDESPVITILDGLEYLLISPMPYLILSGLAHFVRAWGDPNSAETEETKSVSDGEAHLKLSEAKILLYSSFCGLITLDFIGKVISNKISVGTGIVELVGILLIALILFGLKLVFLPDRKDH